MAGQVDFLSLEQHQFLIQLPLLFRHLRRLTVQLEEDLEQLPPLGFLEREFVFVVFLADTLRHLRLDF